MGSIPATYPMLQKNFKIEKESFYYEAYVWSYSINIIKEIKIPFIDKNSNFLTIKYNSTLNKLLTVYRIAVNNNIDCINIWNWYYIYYINNLFFKNLINKNNKSTFEKYNLIVINYKSKQIRLTINTSKNTIYNLSVGRVLSSLSIREKSKKKSSKGERLFIEYLPNFIKNKNFKFGIKKLLIIKLKNFKKSVNLNETIYKILNKNFFIVNTIYDFKIPNNFNKLKKIRSIKRRLKKRIIKDENSLN